MTRAKPARERQSGVLSPSVDETRLGLALPQWFAQAARDLPWRRSRSGYWGLVSEAMLQQTQVDRVIPAFQRFIERFPSVRALAQAPEEDVVAAWQGLGYYRRARNLHAAAKRILEVFDGEVPSDVDALQSLPGVGRYTAGAIASIVFGERAPIVDGNIARVFARLALHSGTPGERSFDQWCWEEAERVVAAADEPGVVNEALMELGATICRKHDPQCDECPVRDICVGLKDGDPASIPPAKRAITRKEVHHHAVLIYRENAVLLIRRGEQGLWARMWEPPTYESNKQLGLATISKRIPASVKKLSKVGSFEHRTTHRDVSFHVYVAASGEPASNVESLWQPLDQLDELGLANPHLRMLRKRFDEGDSSSRL